jgi:hypothetical protein
LRPATVWLAVVSPAVTVPIQRGENRGETITYTNVVRSISAIGMWSGDAMTLKLQEKSVLAGTKDRCVVLVQQDSTGPILAAAWMDER